MSRRAGTERARGSRRGRARTFEVRPWGGFASLVEGLGFKVKRLVVEPGRRFSLQRHRRRAEHWVVVAGRPFVTVGRRRLRLQARDYVFVPRGTVHRVENRGRVPVIIIEVQQGTYLGEDDIVRLEDDYGRAPAGDPPPRRSSRRAR